MLIHNMRLCIYANSDTAKLPRIFSTPVTSGTSSSILYDSHSVVRCKSSKWRRIAISPVCTSRIYVYCALYEDVANLEPQRNSLSDCSDFGNPLSHCIQELLGFLRSRWFVYGLVAKSLFQLSLHHHFAWASKKIAAIIVNKKDHYCAFPKRKPTYFAHFLALTQSRQWPG